MTNEEYIKLLQSGIRKWNKWRKDNPRTSPSLRKVNFHSEFPNKKNDYDIPSFKLGNFSNIDLHMSVLRNGIYEECCFDDSKITYADLVDAYFESCTFRNVNMRLTKIGSATFSNCIFENCDLSYCSAEETSFIGSEFHNTKLENISFIASDLTDTKIIGCSVYGISSWDLILENSIQQNLVITKEDKPKITVDSIELAQFLYLLINNSKLRDVIDAITSKVVLILGRFSPERKAILDEIRDKLRQYNLIPLMFDFEEPMSRNLTETVRTLAHMAKFVIADISEPRSIPQELSNIIPIMPSLNIYPIIVESEIEYGMFKDWKQYPWVKETKRYENSNIQIVLDEIISSQTL